MLFASLFQKTAFHYGSYAYRLCTQEAGIAVGTALMVANAFGLDGRVHYQFLDTVLNELLALTDPNEAVMCALPLEVRGLNQRVNPPHADDAAPSLLATKLELGRVPDRILRTGRHAATDELDPDVCSAFIEVDRASRLQHLRVQGKASSLTRCRSSRTTGTTRPAS